MNGRKTPPEAPVQMTEAKVTVEPMCVSSPGPQLARVSRKQELLHVSLRLLCVFTSVTALSLMVTAKQSGEISLYGFNLPLYSKWSFSYSFMYVVGVCGAVAGHSLLQLLISGLRLMQRSPANLSRNHAWLIFAGDQIFTYALISAGSAASGVTNLNRTGIHHSALPNFCKPLRHFCDRVAVSISLTFFSCFLLAISTVVDVICISKF
ncbi:hypothetical protein POM88_051585 [Heracleum sosnowskyi]|uniref:CASP-like protein n=1 Tax=Heracleum sosnowskyi TaxID=360622 RepID=A0AAD8H0R4_9APIA|nr:hypothetical protein POM88_051585 [Heracleum sosnowskyi]